MKLPCTISFVEAVRIMALGLSLATFASQAVHAQTFKVLHAFEGGSDGASPQGALIRDNFGNLYGTANLGGNQDCAKGGCGVIFRLTSTGAENILHRFVQTDGALPSANLIPDPADNVYSTVSFGGPYGCDRKGCGGIFKMDKTGKLTLLYAFTGGSDGANPYAGLIRDHAGNLYGVAFAGGSLGICPNTVNIGCGTVFKLETTGKLVVLYTFIGADDGAAPYAPLLTDGENLYGTASSDGAFGGGTVFKIDSKGNFSVLYAFTGVAGDGRIPYGGLIRDDSGNLYGTTVAGGSVNSYGIVYKLDPTGKETVLHVFTGPDGQWPWASLVFDKNGNLFGTTSFGGTNGDGTVFELDKAGNETILHNFLSATDGSAVISRIIMDAAGNIYGTADEGGGFDRGTAFEILR